MALLSSSRSARSVTVVVATLCALGTSATVVAYFLTGRVQGWTVNGAWMTLGIAGVVAMTAARRRAQPSARLAWTLLLAGAVCWAFGQALWVLWLFVPAPSTPNPPTWAGMRSQGSRGWGSTGWAAARGPAAG